MDASLIVSIAALGFSGFTFYKSNRDTKDLEKKLYKKQLWSSFRDEVIQRRQEFENEIALFDRTSEEVSGLVDAAERISASYRGVLSRHQVLGMVFERTANSIYICHNDEWRNLIHQPIVDHDTVIDRTGNLINDAQDPALSHVERRAKLKSVVSEFHSLIRVVDSLVAREDAELDPEKF